MSLHTKKIFLFFAKTCILLWVPFLIFSQTPGIEDGKKLYEAGLYPQALNVFRALAEQENAEAFYYLGQMYSLGRGVARDEKAAFNFFKASYEKGFGLAKAKMALYYLSGNFVLQNFEKAVDLLRDASKLNDPESLFILGNLYEQGAVVKKNETKAFEYFLKAAKLKMPIAQYRVGGFYKEGKGGAKKDLKQAYDWYRSASEKRFIPALMQLAEFFREGKAVPKNLVYAHAYLNLASSMGSAPAKQQMEALGKEMKIEEVYRAQKIAADLQKNPEKDLSKKP